MNLEYTHVSMLLDRSGSMSTILNDTIGGFNTFIKEQQALPGKMTFTLCQFDTQYESLYNTADIKSVEPLTDKIFVPRGGTALLDSAKRLIEETGKALAKMREADRPSKVLFVMITDGEENASHNTTKAQLAELIKHQEDKYNWHFIYLGANQDAFAVGQSFGNYRGSNVTYTTNSSSIHAAYASLSSNLMKNRASSSISYDALTQHDHTLAEDQIKKTEEDNKKKRLTKTTK